MSDYQIERDAAASGWHCVCCGEDATVIRQGRPVCNDCRAMIDGGYTIEEIQAESDDMWNKEGE